MAVKIFMLIVSYGYLFFVFYLFILFSSTGITQEHTDRYVQKVQICNNYLTKKQRQPQQQQQQQQKLHYTTLQGLHNIFNLNLN